MRVGRRQAKPFYNYWALICLRPVGQAVKTPPFHGGNTGSNPVRVTIYLYMWRISSAGRAPALQAEGRRFEPVILHHIIRHLYAGVAQLVEQLTCNQ